MDDVSPAEVSGTATGPPVLFYDGDCGLCRGAMRVLAALRLVPPERSHPFQSLEGELATRVWDAGVHNEMAVWDEGRDEVSSGVDGLLVAFAGSWLDPLLPLARLGPVRALLRSSYRLLAYNRRILSPVPARGVVCACEPDFHAGYRWGFAGLTWGITALVAIALYGSLGGVLLAGLAAAVVPGAGRADRPLTWIGHLGLAGAVGALVGWAASPLGLRWSALAWALVTGWTAGRRWRRLR